jgi:thioredoxin 1
LAILSAEISEVVMSELVSDVTDQNFEQEVLKSDQPVLVDFWAEWCHPCKMLTPAVEQIAEKYQGKTKVVKLNVDDNNPTAQRCGIKGIPTLILFKGGTEAERVVGATSKDNIARMIDRALGNVS